MRKLILLAAVVALLPSCLWAQTIEEKDTVKIREFSDLTQKTSLIWQDTSLEFAAYNTSKDSINDRVSIGAILRGISIFTDIIGPKQIDTTSSGVNGIASKDYVDNAVNNVASINFDSDRPILRVPTAGTTIGGSTVTDWLNYWYFTPPTIVVTLSPTTTVYEIGDSSQVIATSTTTNSGGSTLSSGTLTTSWSGGSENISFGSSLGGKDTIQFAPISGASTNYNRTSYSFQGTQNWDSGSESGVVASASKTVQAVYPVLYGMSATDYSASGNIYGASGFTKLVQTEGNKSVTFTGTGFMYYAIPTTWSDTALSSIVDHNGFDVTSSFTVYDITVSSSGLTNDWSGVSYKLYKLNNSTTASGFTYQFNR